MGGRAVAESGTSGRRCSGDDGRRRARLAGVLYRSGVPGRFGSSARAQAGRQFQVRSASRAQEASKKLPRRIKEQVNH
jgi:hypothetical protein